MDENSNLFMKEKFASKYDELILRQEWYGPEILFGMIFEYIKSGELILDLGIGTGLSAVAFHRMGLKVAGLDYSSEMLKVCAHKRIAEDLKQFDLNDSPLPYPDHCFNHISANAILYFLADIENLFKEIHRIIKANGIWAFIIEEHQDPSGSHILEKPAGKNGLITFRHGKQYISEILKKHAFTLLKKLEFTAANFQMEGKSVLFTLYVTKA